MENNLAGLKIFDLRVIVAGGRLPLVRNRRGIRNERQESGAGRGGYRRVRPRIRPAAPFRNLVARVEGMPRSRLPAFPAGLFRFQVFRPTDSRLPTGAVWLPVFASSPRDLRVSDASFHSGKCRFGGINPIFRRHETHARKKRLAGARIHAKFVLGTFAEYRVRLGRKPL